MFGTIVLTIAILFFLYTTWRSRTAPAEFAERLGLTVANAGGYNEIRAQYAGFFSAAVVREASLAGTVPRQAAYIVVFGGLLAGRVVSPALDGGIAGCGRTIVALYAIDATGLALAVVALVLQHRT